MQGNIVQAMNLANDLDPTILDRDRCVSPRMPFPGREGFQYSHAN